MKPSNRILIAGLAIELLLGGIGAWLLMQLSTGVLKPTNSVAETASTITTILGGIMGGLGGLLLVLWFVARKRERDR
jgi:uncharacterized membrane protein